MIEPAIINTLQFELHVCETDWRGIQNVSVSEKNSVTSIDPVYFHMSVTNVRFSKISSEGR
jgi:hypothetical protein